MNWETKRDQLLADVVRVGLLTDSHEEAILRVLDAAEYAGYERGWGDRGERDEMIIAEEFVRLRREVAGP